MVSASLCPKALREECYAHRMLQTNVTLIIIIIIIIGQNKTRARINIRVLLAQVFNFTDKHIRLAQGHKSGIP